MGAGWPPSEVPARVLFEGPSPLPGGGEEGPSGSPALWGRQAVFVSLLYFPKEVAAGP